MQDHQEDGEGEEKTVSKGHGPSSTTPLLLQSGMGAEQLVLMASAVPWCSVTSRPHAARAGLCGDGIQGAHEELLEHHGLCDLMALE